MKKYIAIDVEIDKVCLKTSIVPISKSTDKFMINNYKLTSLNDLIEIEKIISVTDLTKYDYIERCSNIIYFHGKTRIRKKEFKTEQEAINELNIIKQKLME